MNQFNELMFEARLCLIAAHTQIVEHESEYSVTEEEVAELFRIMNRIEKLRDDVAWKLGRSE